ncbi:hypothetical protein B0H13DRAFT_1880637 [Mycena leptocephala]|nr:hypothetical protein B0H13DRAFT_1880637 [Mycena leptocephala]
MIEASYHYIQLPSTALQSVDALSKRFFREGKLITVVSFEQARGLALVQIYFNNNYSKHANASALHLILPVIVDNWLTDLWENIDTSLIMIASPGLGWGCIYVFRILGNPFQNYFKISSKQPPSLQSPGAVEPNSAADIGVPNHTRGPQYGRVHYSTSFSAARDAESNVPKASRTAIQLAMRYAFPHLMINSVEDTSQKDILLVQTRRGTRKVDSEPPRARAPARMYEARARNARATSTAARMDSFGRGFGRRRRNDGETQRERTGLRKAEMHTLHLRYMNLSEHLISTFNFAILHSLDTHFVYLLAIKSMPIMTNPIPNPAQPNPNPNPNPKPTAVSHNLLICFKTAVLHTPTSNPSSPCPFFLSI